MSITSISGGGDHNVNVYGNGTVIAGNGNNAVRMQGNGNVVIGNGRDTIAMMGNGNVVAGSGNNLIKIAGSGHVSVGGGHDTITQFGSGAIVEKGASGYDTINLGIGNDLIKVQGQATVGMYDPSTTVSRGVAGGSNGDVWQRAGKPDVGPGMSDTSAGAQGGAGAAPVDPRFGIGGFGQGGIGSATIAGGGELHVSYSRGMTQEIAYSGKMTLQGGDSATAFIAGRGSTLMKGGSGHDTFIGGTGHDTMTGVGSHNVFEFLAPQQGGQHVITNFVSGDQLNVDGHSLSYLISQNEVTSHDGNTYISADGGMTTIQLQGVVTPTRTGGMIPVHDPISALNLPHDPSKF